MNKLFGMDINNPHVSNINRPQGTDLEGSSNLNNLKSTGDIVNITGTVMNRLLLEDAPRQWDRYDENPLNQVFFEVEHRTVMEALDLLPQSGGTIKMLDIGAGTGRYTTLAKKFGASVVGVDIDEIMLEQAREKDPEIPYILADVTKELPEDWTVAFDRVNISHVLKFIADEDENKRRERLVKTFRNISKILKPDGILVFSEVSNATNEETWRIVEGMEAMYRKLGSSETPEPSETDIQMVKHPESFFRECLSEVGFSLDIQHVYTDGVIGNPNEITTLATAPLIAVHTCKKIQ